MAIGNFPEFVRNNKIKNSSASARESAVTNTSSHSTSTAANSPNSSDGGINFVEANATKITEFDNIHSVSNFCISTKDGFNDSSSLAIIDSLKKNYSFHLRSISDNQKDESIAFASEKVSLDTFRQCLLNNFGNATCDDSEVPPLTDDESEIPPLTDDESDINTNDQNESSFFSENAQKFNSNGSNNNDDDEDDDGDRKNSINISGTVDNSSADEDDASEKDADSDQQMSSISSGSSKTGSPQNSLRTRLAKNQVMFLLVRIVCNSLVSQFPIDTCCNNKNDLMLKNLIAFVETAINRSKASLNEFLISHIYSTRFALKFKKYSNFANNSKTKSLCLRRLILTCLMISISRTRKSYKYGNNVYSINSFFSLLSGLSNKELTINTTKFKSFLGRDALCILESDLNNYKVKLNRLTKMMIRSEY